MNLVTVSETTRISRLAFNNTLKDADTAKKMSNVGFNDKRLRELENQTIVLEELEISKALCYNEGLRISEQIEKDTENIRPVFKDHVATVRYAFRNEPTLLLSFIAGTVAYNRWEWLEQAHRFYTSIMPYAGQLEAHGLSLEELQQAQVSIAAIRSLREDRLLKKGQAEDCTDSRNQAFRQLKSMLKEFHAAARLALKDNPQKLEAFGIRVRSLQKK